MRLREALRMLRSELGMTQSELAEAVNVGFTAESRWENKGSRPNRASSFALLELAKSHNVSSMCLNSPNEILLASRAKDKEDKELLDQVTQRLRLEQHIILTEEVMKNMLDNLDIAVIGHRIFSSSPNETTIIYSSPQYAKIFGYGSQEFDERSKENPYFSIPLESSIEYKKRVGKLLKGEIAMKDFTMVLKGYHKNEETIWLEVKAISLTPYSYGWDFFISCQDVSPRITAQRKYLEEITVRDASLRSFVANVHFDLIANTICRQRDLNRICSKKLTKPSVDKMLLMLSESIHENQKKEFLKKFNSSFMIKSYKEKKKYEEMICFNLTSRQWMRYFYILIENPYNDHLEAVMYVADIHSHMITTKLMNLIGTCLYDFLCVIDNQSEVVESLYYSSKAYEFLLDKADSYNGILEKYLSNCKSAALRESLRKEFDLENIRRKLGQSGYCSISITLDEGQSYQVIFAYLDETETSIGMAQLKQKTYKEKK